MKHANGDCIAGIYKATLSGGLLPVWLTASGQVCQHDYADEPMRGTPDITAPDEPVAG
jgi:hypothetical protein